MSNAGIQELFNVSEEIPQSSVGHDGHTGCLLQCSIAGKRHHDHGNSYKGKHLIEACLQFQRFIPLSSIQEAWRHADRHGDGKIADSSTSRSIGSRKSRDTGPGLSI